MKRLPVLALLAIAACASEGPSLPAPEGVAETDPRVVACREQAHATPARREIARRAGIGLDQQEITRQETARAITAAYHGCLQEAGFAQAGGVEPAFRPVWRWTRPGAPLPEQGGTVVPLAPAAPTGY
ncbi:hypothetical protein [Elioraea sp.]|uniref:hypothetical protein n=1 Tax=Elioraea sp. TaxID=2185103 RepID=UPI003F70D908